MLSCTKKERLMNIFQRWLRTRRKRQLHSMAVAGAQVAHLPAFLDRFPTPGRYHRAEEAAFDRGFKWEQRAIKNEGHGPPTEGSTFITSPREMCFHKV